MRGPFSYLCFPTHLSLGPSVPQISSSHRFLPLRFPLLLFSLFPYLLLFLYLK